MHKKLFVISRKIRKLEGRPLTEEQQKMLDGLKAAFNILQMKENKGSSLSTDDQNVIAAIEILIDYLVKDSSVT